MQTTAILKLRTKTHIKKKNHGDMQLIVSWSHDLQIC